MTGELYHHGILGMKWGVRRYQNEDGSLTSEGLKRYKKTAYKKFNRNYKLQSDIEYEWGKKFSQIQKNLEKKYGKKINDLDNLDLDEFKRSPLAKEVVKTFRTEYRNFLKKKINSFYKEDIKTYKLGKDWCDDYLDKKTSYYLQDKDFNT